MSDATPVEDVDMAEESDEPITIPSSDDPSDNVSVASVVDSTEELEIATDDESDQNEPLESSGSTAPDIVEEDDELVEEQDEEPVIEDQDTEPVIEDQDTEPVIEDQDTEPVIEEQDTEPVIDEQDTEPVIEEQDTEPVIDEKDTEPLMEEDTEPVMNEQESPQPEEVLQSDPDSPKGTDQESDDVPTETRQNEQDLAEGDNAAEVSLPVVIPESESEEREEMTRTPELPSDTTDDPQQESVPTVIMPGESFSSEQGEELSTCIRERDEAKLTADELARQLRRREEEMERVLAENCTLSNQLNAAVAAKCEAMLQAQNVASQELMLQHKEKCLEQQMEMLHSHNAQLAEQLRKQGLELADLRHSSESRLLQLERQLELKTDELRSCEESANYQKEKLSESERRVEALLDKLREARDSEISLQEIHSQEIKSQTRLAQLYEQESNDARDLAEQLSAAVTELQATLREASDRFGELETNAEHEKIHLTNQIEVRDRKIAVLEQELKSANVLLAQSSDDTMEQQVGALAPAAAVARKLVQSGMTLTQVYAQYAASIEELESRNAECKHLRESLNTIIKQLEEKAPQLAADRETLVRVQQENERLLAEHDSALRKCDEVKAEAQQERKRACRLERDNERLETMINDLSKQITVLVREVDARKHGCAPPSLNLSNSYHSYAGHNASQVLTARLLPFRDVDELQKRNLELLAVVRELTSKAEAEEKAEREGKDFAGLMSKLDDAMQQLSDLQEREAQHASLMDQLVQQRDHYRELALQSGVRQTQEIALSPMKFNPSSPVKRMQAAEEREWVSNAKKAEDALKKLQQQYDEFQKQSTLKASRDADEVEKLKSDLQESIVVKSKLSAVCEHKSGKLTSLEVKVEELSKALEAETKKTKAKGDESEKLHKMVMDLQRELSVHRSMLVESKTTLASLDSELKRSRYSEMTLKQQCQNYERSFTDRASICASIEEMKAALERSTGESNTILIKQLDEARLESRGLAKRLEEESARLGGELAELQRALDVERAAVMQAENKTKQANDEVARVAERLIQAERDVLALRAHRNPNVDTAAQTELCVSEEVLREKRTAQRAMELEQQVTQLKSELLRTETKANQLSSIVNTSEIALQHSKAQAEKQAAEAAERLSKAQEEISALQAQVVALESQLAGSRKDLEAAAVSATAQLEEVRQQLTKAQRSEQQAREAEEACQALQSALDAAENEARVANEALALEVQKHVEDSKLCSDLEQKLTDEQKACKRISQELEQCKQALAAVETRAAEREAELSKAAEVRKQEAQDLQGQNSALLDQVQLLGAELCALRQQQQQQPSSKSVPASPVKMDPNSSFSSCEETASVEQLMQVLRYLRSERNAAITNAETLALQKAELQAQLETLKKQLQDAVVQSSELQPGATEATMRSRYEELIRRVELTSALSESSLRQREVATTLRQENETLQTRIAALNQQHEKASIDLRKALEQVETLQVELTSVRGEAGRWRTCANQLTERASRANPEELKRLLQERENLQRQLASEREELRKARVSAAERDNELVRLKGELAQAQEQVKSLQEEMAGATTKLNEKEKQLKDIINKELQVRRIAKKYKSQFEDLTKSVEEERASKQEAGAQAQDLTEERLAASETRAVAAEARLAETETNLAAAETRASDAQKQVALLESKVQELQQQFESKCQELENLRKEYSSLVDKSERARQVLDSARNRIRQQNQECTTLREENVGLKQSLTEAQGVNADLQSKLQTAEQNREEEAVMKVALTTQFEGKIARLERELNEAQHQQQTSRPETQGAKNVASASDKSGGETPTANIRPMPGHSQAKAQQSHQSATVPPTSRSAPMARLRPMSMGPRSVAVAPSQQQTTAISGTSGVGTVAVAPMQGVQSTSEASTSTRPTAASVAPSGREEAAVEPSTSQQENTTEEQAPVSAGATVVLVRPQEVQPAVSSSQSLQSVSAPPSTSRPPPTLKRSRDEPATRSEEPQAKQGRMEVTSASTMEEEEPTSSLHEPVDEVILVDSGDDTEEEEEGVRDEADDDAEVEGTDYPEYEGEQADSEEEEEEEGDMEDGFERDDEELMGEPEEVEAVDSDMEDESVEEEEEEDDDEDNEEEEACEDAEQPAQGAADADDDNEVVILDEPPPLPSELAVLVAPEPTSSGQSAAVQSPEQQPLQQDVTDDVVSTPAASSVAEAQPEAADEEIMVPQTQEAASQECVSEDICEDVTEVVDQPTSSDTTPATLQAADQEINLQSSQSVRSPGSNLGSQQSSPFIGVSRGASPGRGMNRARRSGGPRSRPSSRPTPIVWDHGHSSHPPGMTRGMLERGGLLPGRRARGPRPGFPPYGRHFPR